MTNHFYVYAWRIKRTKEVFYVGKGHGKRIKEIGEHNRNNIFKKIVAENECEYFFLEQGLSEQEAFEMEKFYIIHFKNLGQAKANITDGGPSGGNVMRNWSKERKAEFKEKMTKINKTRTSSKEFKDNASKNMKKRYSNPDERKRQSEKAHAYWDNPENKTKQSKLIRSKIAANPDMYKIRSEKMFKPCVLRLNDHTIQFASRKEMEAYLKHTYNIVLPRDKMTMMLKTKTPYHAFFSRFKSLEGMMLYYEDVETIESPNG